MKKNVILTLLFICLIIASFGYADSKQASKKISLKNNQIIQEKNISLEKEYVVVFNENYTFENSSLKHRKNIEKNYGGSITLKLNDSEFEKLRKNKEIKTVSPVKTYKVSLQDTTKIIRANDSWNLLSNSLNLTGLGETICIIDTGVNYNHPDLASNYLTGYDFVNDDLDPLDDNGHGTHVAGIALANGGIKGVASGAKLIAMKACNGEGSCNSINVIESIQWCVDNSDEYNISVISLSLGADCDDTPQYCYSDYCNGELESPYISQAFDKNISVTIATGNDGYYNVVSSPSCIEKAIPVSSTTKSDQNISIFANTWNSSLLDIITAPGGDDTYSGQINSTSNNGQYSLKQGTSMSTPHAAGAIAIINQYLKSVNKTKTPSEIEDLLNSTGKQIYDSFANRYFSRIDVYAALLILDETNPEINLLYPEDYHYDNTTTKEFFFEVYDWQIKNFTFYLWKQNGTLINYTHLTNIGDKKTFNLTIDNLIFGNYYWNVLAYDNNSNYAFANKNFTITTIRNNLTFPANDTHTNLNFTNFNCSAYSLENLSNITLFIWNSSSNIYNFTLNVSGTNNYSEFSFNFTNEDEYHWNCLTYNMLGEFSFSKTNSTLVYDITPPEMQNIITSSSSSSASLSWETNEKTNFTLIFNGQNLTSQNFSLEHGQSFNSLNPSSQYSYQILFCDLANNCGNYSGQLSTSSSGSGSRSSSGGGGGSSSISITEKELENGVTKRFSSATKVNLVINKQNHSLTLNKIINSSINLTLKSTPINFLMYSGEDKKFNLTSSSYYDLYIKVENVSKNYANITLKEINETILFKERLEKPDEYINSSNRTYVIFDGKEKPISEYQILIYFVIFVIFVILVILIKRFLFHRVLKDETEKKNQVASKRKK